MIEEDNKTLWCGNLSEQATEELLYELFLQAGPLEKVRIPRERDGRQKNFAFITYCHEVSVPYALQLFRGTALFHRTLSLQGRGRLVPLPPPIRSYGPEPAIDFMYQHNIANQFTHMTERLTDDARHMIQYPIQRNDYNDKLTIASLQGNWSHRHHPYHSKDKGHKKDDFQPKDKHSDNYKSRGKQHNNRWRDRRNNKKNSGYHRRD
ncbi:RNA-binding protein 7 [Papilio machaon]|uniref:RNA-binding protein 7 n=1 Tax=Papilio machaon TaxID=76193 RepID=A0A0N0PCN7_PAPMA|nr:RNA-binding protein 7 [Papilio machaon]KPJ13390.1 RNA-binding protein 7 [Papilio machaon]